MTTVTNRERLAGVRECPDIPREQWESHPHFPSQTLLLGSHDGFRQISQRLLEATREGVEVHRIRGTYLYWQSGMRGHEHYEESKLFPFLSRLYGVSMASLEEGHEGLHAQKRIVLEAMDALAAEDGGASDPDDGLSGPRAALADALQTYDGLLRAHLKEEEETVIPMLLSLTPEEFSRYYNAPY